VVSRRRAAFASFFLSSLDSARLGTIDPSVCQFRSIGRSAFFCCSLRVFGIEADIDIEIGVSSWNRERREARQRRQGPPAFF